MALTLSLVVCLLATTEGLSVVRPYPSGRRPPTQQQGATRRARPFISGARQTTTTPLGRHVVRRLSQASDDDDGVVDVEAVEDATDTSTQRETLKQALFAACAACDRGFGASADDRKAVEALAADLKILAPTDDPLADFDEETCALRKCWRLVYTSAADVTILAANPLASLCGIYQDARDLPVIVNVIDSAPRALALAPPQFADRLETRVRQKVVTRARKRSATRVGLAFERVEVAPVSLLGQPLENTLPSLGFDLPQLGLDLQKQLFGLVSPGEDTTLDAAADPRDASPAYFDVLYLDADTLLIQQAQPGGLFIAVAVPDLGETSNYGQPTTF